MVGRYRFVGGSIPAPMKRNGVRATDTGRKLDKADRDYLEPIVTH